MNTQRLKIAFVGGGWVTCNRHMPAAKAHGQLELVGLVSQSDYMTPANMAKLKSQFGIRYFSTSMSESWFSNDIDAVIIGTPPDTHYQLVMDALRAKKHVLVEKPFAMSTTEAAEMMQAAKEANRTLAVVHNFQFSRASAKARQMLEKGELGRLKGVFGFQCSNHRRRLPRWYKSLPLGLFSDESPHLIYLLRSFLGTAEQNNIFVGGPLSLGDNTPNVVSTHFSNAQQITGSLYMTFVSSLSEWQLMLFGDKRTAVIDIFRDILVTMPDDGGHGSMDVMRTTASAVGTHLKGVALAGPLHLSGKLDYGNNEVIKRFVQAIQTGQDPVAISASDGYAVVEIMERINHAAPHFVARA